MLCACSSQYPHLLLIYFNLRFVHAEAESVAVTDWRQIE
jgi:hypothetical protein